MRATGSVTPSSVPRWIGWPGSSPLAASGSAAWSACCWTAAPELVVAVHAILAAGAAYLPLDPELPAKRIELMCATADARLAVTRSELAESLAGLEAVDRLLIDQLDQHQPAPDGRSRRSP